jgi:drug/metabolite transporter (DMT)-like permease
MELYVLIGIATILWGTFGVFDKLATMKGDPSTPPGVLVLQIILCENLFWLPLVPGAAAFLIWQDADWHPHLEVLGWGAVTASAFVASVLFYLLALTKGEASWVIGMTAATPVVTQGLAFMVHESLSLWRLASTLLAVMGVLILSCEKQERLSRGDRLYCLGYVLLATIFGGVLFISDKEGVNISSPIEVSFSVGVFGVIIWLGVLGTARWRLGASFRPFRGPVFRYATYAALTQGVGNIAYIVAMALASASYVVTMSLCLDQIPMVIMTSLVLKEKIGPQRLVGILVIVLGGVGIQAAGIN